MVHNAFRSSRRSVTASATFCSQALRSSSDVCDHAENAALAEAMARSASTASPMVTRPISSLFLGLRTSTTSLPCDSTNSPLMKCLVMVRIEFLRSWLFGGEGSGCRQRRDRVGSVHVDRRTDRLPTVRVGCSCLLGLTSKPKGIAAEQDVRRQRLGVGNLEDDLRDLGGIAAFVAPVRLPLLHAGAD